MSGDGEAGNDRLLIFARYPQPGQAKTRLIPALGPEGAAETHRALTTHTLKWAQRLAERYGVETWVLFCNADQHAMQDCFGGGHRYREQAQGELGTKLTVGFQEAFAEGARRVIAVGTDCPQLDEHRVADAFRKLAAAQVVLGPSHDGGYYLIGTVRPCDRLFADIPWGSELVCQETLQRARASQLLPCLLTPLSDVDHPEDLAVWEEVQRLPSNAATEAPCEAATLSVVIPTRDDAVELSLTLETLAPTGPLEVIVVEGGAAHASREIAQRHGAVWLASRPGRARQMNAAAAAARGELLLFLHADTRLPAGFDRELRQVLSQPRVALGAFSLSTDPDTPALRRVCRWANRRSRWLGLPYGDQGLFLTKTTFDAVGGFPDQPLMEDFELVRRAGKRGRIAISRLAVQTSARRWLSHGTWRVTLKNQALVAGYLLGVPPQRLADWYRAGKAAKPYKRPPAIVKATGRPAAAAAAVPGPGSPGGTAGSESAGPAILPTREKTRSTSRSRA